MEEMQTPNPQEAMPQENPAVQPATTPEAAPEKAPAPKKKGGFLKILIVVLILAVAGGAAAWYFMGMPGLDEQPPSLELGGSKYQGQSIGEQLGSLVFDANDLANYQPPAGSEYVTWPAGVNFGYSDDAITIEEVIENIKPQDELQILVAYYNIEEEGFVIYPKGPYTNAREVGTSYEIPAAHGYTIIASMPFEVNENVIKDNTTLAGDFDLNVEDETEGWVLKPLKGSGNVDNPRTKSAWIQVDQNKFEKIADVTNPSLSGNYKMVWFLLEKQSAVSTDDQQQTTTPDPVCGDGNVDTGEECDDGANNSNITADACRANCTEAKCGDGVVDSDEECDGGTDCEADCTVKVPATGPVCGDGLVAKNEECDDGNQENADACLNTCTNASCGDGVLRTEYPEKMRIKKEQCDDGNKVDGDGCSATCQLEVDLGDETSKVVCGDGTVGGNEECDDGNTTTGDGCDASCKVEDMITVSKAAYINQGSKVTDNIDGMEVSNPTAYNLLPDKQIVYGGSGIVKDDTNEKVAKWIVAAGRVDFTGDYGTFKLTELKYYSEGSEHLGGGKYEENKFNYCNGDKMHLYVLKPGPSGKVEIEAFGVDQGDAKDGTVSLGVSNTTNTFKPGEFAIFVIAAEGTAHCHNEDAAEADKHPSKHFTDISVIRFVDDEGNEFKLSNIGGDMSFENALTNRNERMQYWK